MVSNRVLWHFGKRHTTVVSGQTLVQGNAREHANVHPTELFPTQGEHEQLDQCCRTPSKRFDSLGRGPSFHLNSTQQ